MSYWNYRVVKVKGELAVYSVYYDDQGKIISHSVKPAIVVGEDLEGIRTELQLMMDAAQKEIVDLD